MTSEVSLEVYWFDQWCPLLNYPGSHRSYMFPSLVLKVGLDLKNCNYIQNITNVF